MSNRYVPDWEQATYDFVVRLPGYRRTSPPDDVERPETLSKTVEYARDILQVSQRVSHGFLHHTSVDVVSFLAQNAKRVAVEKHQFVPDWSGCEMFVMDERWPTPHPVAIPFNAEVLIG